MLHWPVGARNVAGEDPYVLGSIYQVDTNTESNLPPLPLRERVEQPQILGRMHQMTSPLARITMLAVLFYVTCSFAQDVIWNLTFRP